MKSKLPLYWLIRISLAIGVVELILRAAFGLGNPPLMQTDPQTGYRFQPNQKIFRFGRYIEYNQYSQRNAPISQAKPTNTFRILMVGDSVLNGGATITQSRTITELFRAKLTRPEQSIEVLNASAGSWGIGNRIGYLKEFGLFQSDFVIFQIGTSDLIQPTSTGERIGRSLNFPNRRPAFAIEELWSRYLSRRLGLRSQPLDPVPSTPQSSPIPLSDRAIFQQNVQSLRGVIEQLKAQKIPVAVLFTPNREDVLPQPKEPLYKQEFLQQLSKLNVPVVDLHAIWLQRSPEETQPYFLDEVHLTEQGNDSAAQALFQQLCLKPALSYCQRSTR